MAAQVGVSDGKVHTPVGDAPVFPITLIVAGLYLAWFGVHYWQHRKSDGSTLWPSDPVKSVLTGTPLQTKTAAKTTTQLTADIQSLQPDAGSGAQPVVTNQAGSGTYDLSGLQQLWTQNGGDPKTAIIAANVALAESSGEANATSHNPDGGINVGLYQLDTRGVGAGYTIEQLKDPVTNTRITIMATANGTNWSQWADKVVVGGKYIGPTH